MAIASAVSLAAAEPSLPQVTAMMLVGQTGTARSDVSRGLLLAGRYLYVSGEPGLQTISVAERGKLTLTDDWTHTSHKVNGTAVKGNFLYVANWSPGEGLLVFDISNPAKPRRVRTLPTKAHTWTADIFGDLLYVAIDDGTITGINTYDISDPANPKLLHFLDVGDRLVGNVARHGKHIYFTHQKWLYVYDAADSAAPKRVREIAFHGLAGKVLVRGDYLFMLLRKLSETEEGGLRVFSLADPAEPKLVASWQQEEPRDLCFVGERAVVPCSGSGIYLLDVRDPRRIEQLAHWYVNWPNAGKHGGYPVAAAGAGDCVYIGTTSGNNPECEDFNCKYRGARVYAVRIGAASGN
jgi:hypothetical protein